MKKFISRILIMLLSVITVTAFMVPENSYASGTKANPIADGVQYYPNNDAEVKTGIKSVKLNPYTYVNMVSNQTLNPDGNGAGGGKMKLDAQAQYRIVKDEIFPKWSVIAEAVFRDQASQMVTMKGYGMMDAYGTDRDSFNTQFSYGKDGASKRFQGDNFAVSDLAEVLSGAKNNNGASGQEAYIQGSTGGDEVRSSGITAVSDLNGARTFMGQELKNCQNNNALSVDDFLGNSKDKNDGEYRLPALESTKSGKGYCNVVTCVNQRANEYDYVSFGLVIYDLSVTPISAEGLRYITDAEEYLSEENPVKAAKEAGKPGIEWDDSYDETVASYSKNDSASEITTSQELSSSVTEEVSSTTEETSEWGMEEAIGMEVNIGDGPFTGLLSTASGAGGGAAVTLSYTHTFHQTWSQMFGHTESKATEKTKTQSTEVTLPPHTIGNIKQSTNNTTAKENYQQPVAINYKVCMFSLSGDYYNDGGAVGRISSSMYDKGWMSIIFDGRDGDTTCGNAAMRSLYNRAVDHGAEQGYDGAIGTYRTWCDKSAWKSSNKINWSRVASEINGDSRRAAFREGNTSNSFKGVKVSNQDLFRGLFTEVPFCETDSGIRIAKDVMTSSVDIKPLYDLGSVSTKNSPNYNMFNDDRLYLSTVELEASNRKNVEFYNFDPGWGKWQFCNEDGTISSTPNEDGVLKLSDGGATGAQYVYADGTDAEEHYLKWVIRNDAKIVTNESINGMSQTTIEGVETPVISISVHDHAYDDVNVSVTAEGESETSVDKSFNLNNELTASAILKDKTSGATRGSLPVYWESYPTNAENANVQPDGTASYSKAGTYRVRAYCVYDGGRKVYSSPLTVTVREPAAFNKIAFDDPDLDEDDLTLTKKAKTRTYNLANYLQYKDQYGKEWTGTRPEIEFRLDNDYDEDGAYITKAGTLSVTKPGTYRVIAEAEGTNKEAALKLKVTQDEWLDQIKFNKPVSDSNMVLQDGSDSIQIDNLKDQISYLNQDGDAWEGKKPTVTFSITPETNGAEIIRGDSFFVKEPGVYTIQPAAKGYDINPQTITVTTAKKVLTEIEVSDPPRQKLTGTFADETGGTVAVDLEPLLTGKSQFGEVWKEMPAMNFTLDSDVEDANIKDTPVKDEETNEIIRDGHQFVTSTPGKYTVHVEPVKASAFSGPIDDINITVDRQSKLDIITVCLDQIYYEDRTLKDGDCTIENLSQYLEYYDQFGQEITDTNEVELPEITGYEVSGPASGQVKKESDGTFTFSCSETGAYRITPVLQETPDNVSIFFNNGIDQFNVIDEATAAAITGAEGELLDRLLNLEDASMTDEQCETIIARCVETLQAIQQTTSADEVDGVVEEAWSEIEAYLGKYLITSVEIAEEPQFTGQGLKPAVIVKVGDTTLQEGEDYSVVYSNNVNAGEGTAKAVVKGIGNYVGKVETGFTIKPADIAGATVQPIAYQLYSNGDPIQPEVTVTYLGGALEEGKDFTVTYSDNTEIGIAKARIEGTGNFTGSTEAEFEIVEELPPPHEHSLTKVDKVSETCKEDGHIAYYQCAECGEYFLDAEGQKPVDPESLIIPANENSHRLKTIKENETDATCTTAGRYDEITYCEVCGQTFAEHPRLISAEPLGHDYKNYKFTWKKASNGGYTATVKLTCVHNASHTKVIDATVTKAAAQGSQATMYTATAVYDGKTYTEKKFQIGISNTSVAVKAATYTGKALKPAVTVTLGGKKLKSGTDYTVAYKNNVKAGKKAVVTITGKGSYMGTVTKNFTIAKAGQTAFKATAKTVKLKKKKVKKKAQTVNVSKLITVTMPTGKVTYTITPANAKAKKALKCKANKVKVKKRTKKGTYYVNITVKAAGNANYKAATKTVKAAIKVK